MTTITIPISDEQLTTLQDMARQLGVPPEELAQASLADWLRKPRSDFATAAQEVLQKNAELYRRLAR